jgi:hypothetical protein
MSVKDIFIPGHSAVTERRTKSRKNSNLMNELYIDTEGAARKDANHVMTWLCSAIVEEDLLLRCRKEHRGRFTLIQTSLINFNPGQALLSLSLSLSLFFFFFFSHGS